MQGAGDVARMLLELGEFRHPSNGTRTSSRMFPEALTVSELKLSADAHLTSSADILV